MRKKNKLVNILGITLFSTAVLISITSVDVYANSNNLPLVESTSSSIGGTLDGTPTTENVPENKPMLNQAQGTDTTPVDHTIEEDFPDDAPDSQVIVFPDAELDKAVRNELNIADNSDITVGDFRNVKSNISLSMNSGPFVADYTGMEAFKYLPSQYVVNFNTDFGTNRMDFTKLYGVRFGVLIFNGDMRNQDLASITKISTDSMYQSGFYGDGDYQGDPNGLTNEQLKVVGPWLVQMYNNDAKGFKHIGLGNDNLTDLSPLAGVDHNKEGWIISLGNYMVDNDPVYIVDKDVNVVDAKPMLGLDGERLDDYKSTFEILNANGENKKSHDLKHLDNGQYEYDPISLRAGSNYITYGDYGFIYDSNNPNYSYLEKNYGVDADSGPVLKYDVMNYRRIIRQEHPTVTINFVDQSGNELQSAVTINGNKIGEQFDLTNQSQLAGYTLVSPTDLTGQYTQNPQIITLVYKADGNSGNGSGNNSGGSSVDRTIKDSIQYIATYPKEPAVDLFDINGHRNTTCQLAENSAWYSDKIMTLNGVKYYRVATNEWVKVDDAYVYTPITGLVRTYNKNSRTTGTALVNAREKTVNRALAYGTDWIADRIVEFSGQQYYRVATNEFVAAEDVFEYTAVNGTVTTKYQAVVYDETGQKTSRSIASGTKLKTDKTAQFNGSMYYHVGTNEYLLATDVTFDK